MKETEPEIVTKAGVKQEGMADQGSMTSFSSASRPIPLRADIYDLLSEIGLAVRFKRLEMEWIGEWDIVYAADAWGITFEGKKLTCPLVRLLVSMFVGNQPLIVGDTLIQQQVRHKFMQYRFVPAVVRDLGINWGDALVVIPDNKSQSSRN